MDYLRLKIYQWSDHLITLTAVFILVHFMTQILYIFWTAVPTSASTAQPKVRTTGPPHITPHNTPKASTKTSAPTITPVVKTQPTEASRANPPTVNTHYEVTTQTSKG